MPQAHDPQTQVPSARPAPVPPPVETDAGLEKLRKAMKKAEDERVLEKKKQEEERRKHEEALKKLKEEAKGRKRECDEKAKEAEEMERKMKEVKAEAEELRKQVDAAKIAARDAKELARDEKRNRKKREKREKRDQPDIVVEDEEFQPGNPQGSGPVQPGLSASHVHLPRPGVCGKRSLAAMMYFEQVDRERNAEYERASREREQERAFQREQERATRERAAEAARTRMLQMMMMGNSYF